MGPFKVISSFLRGVNGPIHAHWQFSSCMEMGPFKVIGSFLKEVNGPIQAHRVVLFMHGNGPNQPHRQFLSLNILGPFELIGNFPHVFEWAHSKLSAVF